MLDYKYTSKCCLKFLGFKAKLFWMYINATMFLKHKRCPATITELPSRQHSQIRIRRYVGFGRKDKISLLPQPLLVLFPSSPFFFTISLSFIVYFSVRWFFGSVWHLCFKYDSFIIVRESVELKNAKLKRWRNIFKHTCLSLICFAWQSL